MDITGWLSMAVAAGALILSIISTLKKTAKEDSAQITKIMTMLEIVQGDVAEIKEDFRRDIAELKASYQQDHDRLVVVERDLKTVWRSVDEVKLQVNHLAENAGGTR